MPKTEFGKVAAAMSADSQAEIASDLGKIARIPKDILRGALERIAKTYPACNVPEVAAQEAERHGIASPQDFFDAVSSLNFIWSSISGQALKAVAADLVELGLLSDNAVPLFIELLSAAEPFREIGKVVSNYLRIGSALFSEIQGTVDLRFRFHKRDEDLTSSALPTELVATQQVIVANLRLSAPNGDDQMVPFLMDENDLGAMKRFIRNMERELELTRSFAK